MTRERFVDWLEMAWPHRFEIEERDGGAQPGHLVLIRLPDECRLVCGVSSMTKYSWRGLAASCHDMLQRLFADRPELWDDDATIPMPPY